MHVLSAASLLATGLPTLPLQTLSTPVLVGLAVVALIVVVIAVRIAVAIAIRVAIVAAVVLAVLFGLSAVGVDVPIF
jgi:hypothetical protein